MGIVHNLTSHHKPAGAADDNRQPTAEARLWWYRTMPAEMLARTARWPPATRGIYRELLDHYWLAGRLPVPEPDLRQLVGASPAEWRAAWKVIAHEFPRRGRLRIHIALAAERERQRTRLHRQQANARATNSKLGR